MPPQKVAYNKAAGAGARERTHLSYVLGYYKSEKAEPGLNARPVALRDNTGPQIPGATAILRIPLPIVDCPSDTNTDGSVNVTDLLAVITAWGACP